MSTTTTTQLSATNAGVLAASLNVSFANGPLRINGETVVSKSGDAITRHANGSLSYRTAEHPNRRTYLKVGHMLEVGEGEETAEEPVIEEAPEVTVETPAKPKAKRPIGDRVILPATVKGETGWLSVRRVNGHLAYAVTMEERNASPFAQTDSLDRHIARAEKAGIQITRIAA